MRNTMHNVMNDALKCVSIHTSTQRVNIKHTLRLLSTATQATDQPGLYILDCLFSVLVIGALVVFVWRGVWILCDLLIYPDDFVQSSWASMVSAQCHRNECGMQHNYHPQTTTFRLSATALSPRRFAPSRRCAGCASS